MKSSILFAVAGGALIANGASVLMGMSFPFAGDVIAGIALIILGGLNRPSPK